MVGKSRFGGIFSYLNRRDLNTIKTIESWYHSRPDRYLTDLYLDDDYNQFYKTPLLSEMSLDEIIEGVEAYIGYLQEEREGEDPDYVAELDQEERSQWAEIQGKARYFEAQLQPILKRLKRAKTRLENEELRG